MSFKHLYVTHVTRQLVEQTEKNKFCFVWIKSAEDYKCANKFQQLHYNITSSLQVSLIYTIFNTVFNISFLYTCFVAFPYKIFGQFLTRFRIILHMIISHLLNLLHKYIYLQKTLRTIYNKLRIVLFVHLQPQFYFSQGAFQCVSV